MESVSDTYAGNAGVRSIAANYKKYRLFPGWIFLDILCSNNDFLYSNAFGRIWKKIKLGYVQSNISNQWKIVVSKYIFGFGIVIIASILVFAGSMICQKMIVGRINIYFIGRVVKAIWINGTLDMIFAFPILCRYGYDEGRVSAAMIVCFLGIFYPYRLQQLLLNLPFPTIVFLILLFIIWCFSGVLSCKLYEKRNDQ